MERYLIGKGIPHENIIKEEQSTSTYENLSFAKEILDSRFAQGFSSVVITNKYHTFRAAKIAERAGIAAKHISAPDEYYTAPANYLREMLAILKMWVLP